MQGSFLVLDLDFHTTLGSGDNRFSLRVSCKTSAKRIVLFGPSGVGKTQTLRAIAGLLTPNEGHIRFGETVWFDQIQNIAIPAHQRHVGLLFQDYALFPHLTVAQNIAFGLQRGWRNPSQARVPSIANEWMARLDILGLANQLPTTLSGGQRQRVALARTLITKPQLLLLDEPFAAVDATLRGQMRQLISDLQTDLAIPMLLITHDPEDRDYFGEQVLQCEKGYIHD